MKRISYLMLVIILLSLTACAVQRANLAGKVNGTNIDYTEFISAHRGHFNNFMTEKGRIPDTEEKKEILRQTWRNITVHVILKEHFKRYNIQVTQQEVIDTLINNVPDYLYSSPLLQVGGRFDRSLYIQSLEYDTPVNLRPVKQHYFDYLIPIQKLKLRLIDDILLSKRDIKSIRDILSSTANIDWIVFDPQDTQINISDSEIQSYYQSNLGLFEREQYFQLDYSLIPVPVSRFEYQIAAHRVDSLYTSLTEGANFEYLAEKYSVSESAIRGGNLGFIKPSDLPVNIMQHIQNLPVNQISSPLGMDDGWGMFMVSERTRNLIKLSEIIIKPTPGEDSIESMMPRVRSLIELSQSIGLPEAAQEMDFPVFRTPAMTRDTLWINDVGVVNTIKSQLATAKAKAMLKPIYSSRLSSWVLVQVVQNQTRKYKNLSDVRELIKTELSSTKQLDVTRNMAEQWLQRNSANPIQAAREQGLRIETTPAISYEKRLLGHPASRLYYDSIFDYQAKNRKAHIHGSMVLIPIVNNLTVDRKKFVDQVHIRNMYMNTLPANWFDKWLESQIQQAKVRIWQ